MVAFAKRDVLARRYADAVAAARAQGFGAIVRLAGGRAAVFHGGTLELAHAVAEPDPRAGIRARFEATAELIARALRRLGADARVGEVPGEYCPGRWSVNAGRRAQAGGRRPARDRRRRARGHGDRGRGRRGRARACSSRSTAALGLDWDPATVGAVADEVPGAATGRACATRSWPSTPSASSWSTASSTPTTLELARELAPEHRPPEAARV